MKYRIAMFALGALVGCNGGDLVDLAPTHGSSSSGTASSTFSGSSGQAIDPDAGQVGCPPGPVTAPDLPADAGASVAPLVGKWTGYAENETFTSGSDAVTMIFSATDAGPAVLASVALGSGTPAPPATDGTGGYDPGPPAFPGGPTEAYPFTALGLQFDGSRLRFGINSSEPWLSWCELQTPYPLRCGYSCAPPWPATGITSDAGTTTLTNPDGGGSLVFSAGRAALCGLGGPPTCTCVATGCTVDLHEATVTFDLQFTAGRIDGSFAMGNFVRNVHLTPAVGSDD